jgi:hypothetical protein
MLTLKTYAHVMPEEEADLTFAEFSAPEHADRSTASSP